MDDLEPLEDRQKELSRWVEILAGLILGLLALLCALCSITALLEPAKQRLDLVLAVEVVALLGSLWTLDKSIRLLTGRRCKRGLMSPTALRVFSFCMLAFPIAGIFTGYYQEKPVLAIGQAVAYFFAFKGLQALARKREADQSQMIDETASTDEHGPLG
jgi:hypothetical protein